MIWFKVCTVCLFVWTSLVACLLACLLASLFVCLFGFACLRVLLVVSVCVRGCVRACVCMRVCRGMISWIKPKNLHFGIICYLDRGTWWPSALFQDTAAWQAVTSWRDLPFANQEAPRAWCHMGRAWLLAIAACCQKPALPHRRLPVATAERRVCPKRNRQNRQNRVSKPIAKVPQPLGTASAAVRRCLSRVSSRASVEDRGSAVDVWNHAVQVQGTYSHM